MTVTFTHQSCEQFIHSDPTPMANPSTHKVTCHDPSNFPEVSPGYPPETQQLCYPQKPGPSLAHQQPGASYVSNDSTTGVTIVSKIDG